MKKHCACMVLFALAAALPCAADESVWRHGVGLRVGGVGSLPVFLPLAGSVSAFYEVQAGRNWGLRPSIEFTRGREWDLFGDAGRDVEVGRVGAAMDFVYYASSEKPAGTGPFLTLGAGWHRFDIKDSDARYDYDQGEWVQVYPRDTQSAASLSVGLGYQFSKTFGMELKYSMSDQDSELAGGTGKNWLTASMNVRFQAPGRRRPDSPGDAGTEKTAEKIVTGRWFGKAFEREPECGEPDLDRWPAAGTGIRLQAPGQRGQEHPVDIEMTEADNPPPWKHKIGVSLDFWPVEHDSAYSIFYENHLDGHWAVRPALDIAYGSEVYQDWFGGRDVDIRGAGLSVDCIYYASERGRNGTGPYLLAGLGARWVSLKDETWGYTLEDGTEVERREHSGVAPALSAGVGCYFGRYFGIEYRYTFSTLDSPFPDDVGKNWWRLGLNFRLPAPGQARGETRAKKAEAPGEPPWKHKFGLRLGDALFSGECLAFFYENQLDGHWAIRPSIERMTSTENYYDPPDDTIPSPRAAPVRTSVDPYYTDVDVYRIGAAIDCIYYLFRYGQRGIGPYLLAGVGAHSIDMKDKYGTWNGREMTYRQTSDVAAALSIGLGCHFGRFFGLEYKRTFSALDTIFPENLGKNWDWLSLSLRFPVPGLPKGSWRQGRH